MDEWEERKWERLRNTRKYEIIERNKYGRIPLSDDEIEALAEMHLQDLLFIRKARDEKFSPKDSLRMKHEGKDEEGRPILRMSCTDPQHGYDMMKTMQESQVSVYNTSLREVIFKDKPRLKEGEDK